LNIQINFEPIPPVVDLPIHLWVNQPAHFDYQWSCDPPPCPVFANSNDITVLYDHDPTTYSVTVTNQETNCTAVASLEIPGEEIACDETDIGVPNVFSPNGDGANEFFSIMANFVTSFEIHIYNRWGEQVFQSTNISDSWDGTFRGDRVPPDVYGYYLTVGCPGDKSFNKKGSITIIE
jgi:gliding motility-associated-like protein